LNAAVAGINWGHKLAGLISPTTDITVMTCVDGLRRSLSKPVVKSSPILPAHIDALVKNLDTSAVAQFRTVTLIVLAFCGFLRFSEVVSICIEDIVFYDAYMTVMIRSSN
jgi:hypothetical protein